MAPPVESVGATQAGPQASVRFRLTLRPGRHVIQERWVERGAPIAAELNESKLRDDASPDPQQKREHILDWVKQSDRAATDFEPVEVRGLALPLSYVSHPD